MGIKSGFISAFIILVSLGSSLDVSAQRNRRKSRSYTDSREQVQLGSPSSAFDSLPPVISDHTMADTIQRLSPNQIVKRSMNLLVLLPYRTDLIPYVDSLQVDIRDTISEYPFKRYLDTLGLNRLIESRRDMRLALDFHQGVQYALDSLSASGVNVVAKYVDTQLSSERVVAFAKGDTARYDLVIGPLSPRVARAYASHRKYPKTPMFVPLMYPEKGMNGTVYFGLGQEDSSRKQLLKYALKQYRGERVFIIADQDHHKVVEQIKELFVEAKSVELVNNIAVANLSAFRDSIIDSIIPNWAFLETKNASLAASVSSILSGIETEPGKQMRMFSTTNSTVFLEGTVNLTHLSELLFTYPETYSLPSEDFIQDFHSNRGYTPELLTSRGFDITYDALLRVGLGELPESNIILPQSYSSSTIDYQLFEEDDFQNSWFDLRMIRNLSLERVDTLVSPKMLKPWPALPEYWFCEYLLSLEKQRFPEQAKLWDKLLEDQLKVSEKSDSHIEFKDACDSYEAFKAFREAQLDTIQ